jgi:hypothetical protein
MRAWSLLPADVSSTRRTTTWTPTASSISPTAPHRLVLAALRREGYRSADRITVFQTLVHTLGLDRAHIQTFLKAHNERNLAEYQGRMDIDAKFLADLLRSTKALEMEVAKLPPPAED